MPYTHRYILPEYFRYPTLLVVIKAVVILNPENKPQYVLYLYVQIALSSLLSGVTTEGIFPIGRSVLLH